MIPTLSLGHIGRGGRASVPATFQYVSALLHMDGTDASTTFTDHSSLGATFTANGDAQIDTAQSKYGGASGLFDGTGDYLSAAHHASYDVTTGDFCVEAWVRVNGGLGAQMILASKTTNAGAAPFYLLITTGSKFEFNGYQTDGSTLAYALIGTTTVTTGQWYHVAGVRDGNTFRLYVDGVQEASSSSSSALWTASQALVIGGFDNSYRFNGWLDDFRLVKGLPVYSGGTTFTPPTSAHPNF